MPTTTRTTTMKRSDDRILTTHAGSLPRSPALLEMLVRLSKREPVDAAAMANAHYATLDEYVLALAAALSVEYRAIVEHGLVLQLDCPDLAMERHTLFADRPLADFLRWVDLVVGAINHAIAGIPPDRVRLHVCWGNYEAPHTLDVPLEEILPRLYAARVGALVVSMANPRHAHEHRCFARYPLPDGMLLVAGVVDTTPNAVEPPEVVAGRIDP